MDDTLVNYDTDDDANGGEMSPIIGEDFQVKPKASEKKIIRYVSSETDSADSDIKKSSRKRHKKRKAQETSDSESEEDDNDDIIEIVSDDATSGEESSGHNTSRIKLRKLIHDEDLTKETQNALNEERERKKRIEEKRKFQQQVELQSKLGSSPAIAELFLDVDSATKTPIVKVDSSLVKYLKSHQIEGIKFLWDCCFEKVELIEKGHKGSGCILAHCMGLGKTLTTISLVHTLLANKKLTRVERVLVLAPVNVLNNWKCEIANWTKNCAHKISIYQVVKAVVVINALNKRFITVNQGWIRKFIKFDTVTKKTFLN